MASIGLTAAFAAIIGFAILPNTETFAAFSLAIGLVLVPAGVGVAQPWQTPMFTAIAAFLSSFSRSDKPDELRPAAIL
jgi:uncharacterized membrane protein YccC